MLHARQWAQRHKGEGWNMRHGFLAVMGGLALRTGPAPDDLQRLTSHQLTALLDDQKVRLPVISSQEIDDRSKQTAFAKGLVLLQAGWFVMQIIARGVEHLPIIPLEVFTLAFTFVTFATYICCWYKPYGMRVPITVEVVMPVTEVSADDKTVVDGNADVYERARELLAMDRYRRQLSPNPSRQQQLKRFERLLFFFCNILDYLGVFDSRYIWYHVHKKASTRLVSALLLVFVCTVFGLIHFIGWDLEFPSYTCQSLWRIATIVSTSLPVSGVVSIAIYAGLRGCNVSVADAVRTTLDTIGIIVYAVARTVLLVLTIWSLRVMPAGAYKAVSWTSFIPSVQ